MNSLECFVRAKTLSTDASPSLSTTEHEIVDLKGLECPAEPKTLFTDSRVEVETAPHNTKSSI